MRTKKLGVLYSYRMFSKRNRKKNTLGLIQPHYFWNTLEKNQISAAGFTYALNVKNAAL